jgi:hypothetical protein
MGEVASSQVSQASSTATDEALKITRFRRVVEPSQRGQLQVMRYRLLIPMLFVAAWQLAAQQGTAQDAPAPESRLGFRYSIAVIEDATLYSNLQEPIPKLLNQVLLEPTITLRYKPRWSFSWSVVGLTTAYSDTATQLRVKETYAGLSAGDFDFMLGRRIVRWGTGYAFTAIGVLDPPRIPTNPTDRLNLNEGRDMVKADYVHGPHAFTLAWSTAALAPAAANLHDASAFRYNVLVHGFDTALIAGDDRGGDAFGGITFTRVLGQAWELHGEAAWREHEAALLGAKYTTRLGVTFIGASSFDCKGAGSRRGSGAGGIDSVEGMRTAEEPLPKDLQAGPIRIAHIGCPTVARAGEERDLRDIHARRCV